MRLRSCVVAMAALLTATTAMADSPYPPRTGGNYSGLRWYGYYYNNNHVPENFDHTNITMVGPTASILDELAVDAQYGEKAMVDVEDIVFVVSSGQCDQINPNALADFKSFVQTLIDNRYLVANDPEHSVVSSFYVADEPDSYSHCLYDSVDDSGLPVPNPALLNAISAIRQNLNTTNFPLATIVTKDHYGDMPEGLSLFDWVGMDDYHYGVSDYLNDFTGFEGFVNAGSAIAGGTPQHFFLVPLVSYIGSSFSAPYSGGASSLYARFLADNTVIGIMPFEWDYQPKGWTSSGGMVGMSWEPEYIALGKSIAPYRLPPISPADITVIVDYVVLQ